MSEKRDINLKLIEKTLENGSVEELRELVSNLLIDRDWNHKMIELLEKRVQELANERD